MLYSSIAVAASSGLLLIGIASASVAPAAPTNSYWSRNEPQYNNNDVDEDDLDTLEEALSGWERRPVTSSNQRAQSSSYRSLPKPHQQHDKRRPNEDDVDFKRSDDWWKDPLAQFDGSGESRGSSNSRDLPVLEEHDDDDDDEPMAQQDDVFSFNLLPIQNREPAVAIADDMDDAVTADIETDKYVKSIAREPDRAVSSPRTDSHQSQPKVAAVETVQDGQENQVAVQSDLSQRSFEFPLLFASLIPSPLKQVLSRVPAMQVLALLAIGKQLYQWRSQLPILSQNKKRDATTVNKTPAAAAKKSAKTDRVIGPTKLQPAETSNNMDHIDLDSETDEEEDLEVPEAFRNNPRTRAVFEKKKRAKEAPLPVSAAPPAINPIKKAAAAATVKPAKKRIHSKSQTKMMPVMSGGWTDGIFGPRRPSARQLMEKVTSLEQSFQQAQHAKSNLEQAYEKANWQLQESQTEFDKLKQTTKYLQAQLRDNEEMLERVVKQEQHKAKEELMQMKEAMIKVVEREREAMREEFIKQAADLEQVWKQSVNKRRHGRTRSTSDGKSGEQFGSI